MKITLGGYGNEVSFFWKAELKIRGLPGCENYFFLGNHGKNELVFSM